MDNTTDELLERRETEIEDRLYTMLDHGLGKRSSRELVDIIKELALIAMYQEQRRNER